MNKSRKLIIIGDSSFAEVAYEYFTYDSHYTVVAFSVEREHLKSISLFGLPIVPFDELTKIYPPHEYDIFVAIVYTQLNRLRTRLYLQAKSLGYGVASYVSPKADIWRNVTIGEHCFIFENNVLQPFVQIKNNVILWSGNHIGHHSSINDNCFLASHIVLSGHCIIEENCFVGVNCTIADRVTIKHDAVLGAGTLILKDTIENKNGTVYKGNPTVPADVSSYRIFKVAPGSETHEMA